MTRTNAPLTAEPTSVPSVRTSEIGQPTRLSPDIVAHEAEALRWDVDILSGNVARVHNATLRRQLDTRTSEEAKKAPVDLLSELSDLGFAWAAMARLIGVSVPAIRKWRQGEPVSGINRKKLARLVAVVDILRNRHYIFDVASWLETPLADSIFTGVDVLAAGYEADLMEYVTGHMTEVELLDHAISDWREALDERFEVYRAGDGELAIRMRSQDQTG